MPELRDIRVGSIGVGGQGLVDLQAVGRLATIVAICDVDEKALALASASFPEARRYIDYRDLLADPRVDAITVSTPDHQHAPILLRALRAGKHCFCQKPLAITIGEVRSVAEAARFSGTATQMALPGLMHGRAARALATIRSGCLGKIRDLHVWSDRPGSFWQTAAPPEEPRDPPTGLHWNNWLGATPFRPYRSQYHPRGWRAWTGLGTGALGDMGVHNAAAALVGLQVIEATSVTGSWAPMAAGQFPTWAALKIELALPDYSDPITMHWYDGGRQPPSNLVDDIRLDGNGCVLVGDKGRLYLPGSMNQYSYLLPRGGVAAPDVPVPTAIADPYEEWLYACLDGRPTSASFVDVASTITEVMLVGNLSIQLGRPIKWSHPVAQISERPDVLGLIDREYRDDW